MPKPPGQSAPKSEKFAERGWRFYRNFNAVGAVALFGAAALFPPFAAVATAGGALNVAQAGFGEAMLRRGKNKKTKNL